MTHTYNIPGMDCSGCQAKVQKLLSEIKDINKVSIDLTKGEAAIEMATHISTAELKSALKDYPKYQLNDKNNSSNVNAYMNSQIKPSAHNYSNGKYYCQIKP